MKGNEMYFWLMISDLALTATLKLFAERGIKEGDVTKEMWLEISAQNVKERKAAIELLKAH
ncbi:hypothetical protein GWN26_09240 [Candidatus Saccharibacteria bacterium]|nr:hypothetical protein [Candidatus Saccharibacteria bacterium]NIS51222.1 hypothetical protein [Phycisphaerae bacterium]NIV04600.1 hypothetical protein [Calditrichia bacterium]NIS39153.1 hypothetical protein [Candidatus Saccharibacteria bacterium]NIV73230.1 hypothetical protein [Calditrichia bacterium]